MQQNSRRHPGIMPLEESIPNTPSTSSPTQMKRITPRIGITLLSEFPPPKTSLSQLPRIPCLWFLMSPGPVSHRFLRLFLPIGWDAENRRKVANAYSMTALVEMEQFVDNCSAVFMERLNEFAQNKQMFDLGHWLQCYAVGLLLACIPVNFSLLYLLQV